MAAITRALDHGKEIEMRKLTRIGIVMLLAAGVAGTALADDKDTKKPAPPPAATSASAEVKAATGVAKKEPVGEATSFPKGTKVWAWSKVIGAKGTTVKHVWKRDGATLWEKELTIGSNQWRIYTRRTLNKPGSYTVDVVGEDGSVLGSVTFTVEG
jgi:hypothetical protein